MASVYILYSLKLNKFYTGSCTNIEQRLLEHHNKTFSNSFTSLSDDWQLFFSINNIEGAVARKIEAHIKSMKSKLYIENLKNYPEISERLISKFSSKI